MSTNINLDQRKLIIIAVALLGVGVAVYFSQQIIEKKEQEGRATLYKIEKTYQEELKALPEAERGDGTAINVDVKFSKTVAELKGLIQAKTGTDHTLFEAAFKLGNLYLKHNQLKPAQDAFMDAVKYSTGAFQKASSLLMVGMTQEQNQQFKEAALTFQDGLAKGFEGLKSEFLLGLVRSHVKLNDKEKAKSFVDKLNTEFPGSNAATDAQEMVK